ncbi:putative iSPg3, transposase [Bacteroides uniformis str. 3978 T3 i]|uniref:Putative iSPg3, transposase n=1 Tax=Bacteroides uniformis str. 3978 T3 ii TaxID=1339349 RepID=A0A078S3Q0_BACUN|nr:putative iSPg3, transposase [Bacteroides uniformis str. 3978 T3 ii]KDS60470.1 putative iSPg3, transposase [Bacteroides uniformis str. 3978 T3 i]OCR36603.1 transposase, IS4 family [Bacteroides fragilis]
MEYKAFIEFLYGKLVADKGYIGRKLFQRLFVVAYSLSQNSKVT